MYDDDLNNLEDWLRRLKVEYDIYLNGHRKRPPEDLKLRVDKTVKRLGEASGLSASQRFRYNTLVARYYVYRDVWRRTLTERELGKEGPAGPRPRPQERPPAPVEMRVSISDPEREDDKVRRLYDALVELRTEHGRPAPAFSFEQFAHYIATQTQTIRGKYGCASVTFAVSMEEQAIRFTARAENEER